MTDSLYQKILAADRRIRPEAVETPLERSESLSRLTGADVFLKGEDLQVTGSFKFRGALNKIRWLSPEEKKRGAVTASTGNHGLASSLAARLEGLDLTLVLPAGVSAEKRRRLAATGTTIQEIGRSCEQAEAAGRRLALETGRVYIPPYNDEEVIAGQGTIGLEIDARLPTAGAVLVPIGGGGLAALVQGSTASARAASTATTGGLANPVVATAELAGSSVTSAIAVFFPLCALAGAALAGGLAVVAIRRLGARRRRTAAPHMAGPSA